MDKITQANRLLVADILDEVSTLIDHNGIGQIADLIRDGEYDEHECVQIAVRHRLATRADATPVAWMYEGPMGEHYLHEHRDCAPKQLASMGWIETPLYTHPPATDVAALVEQRCPSCGVKFREIADVDAHIAALAPFTKGQNDD